MTASEFTPALDGAAFLATVALGVVIGVALFVLAAGVWPHLLRPVYRLQRFLDEDEDERRNWE